MRGRRGCGPQGRRLIHGARVKTYPVDSTSAFTRFLFESATRVSGSSAPIIAITSYKGFYTNEVTSLRAEYARMVRGGELPGGEIVTCDIRQIACERDIATVDGRALSLIYNKFDPLMIQPDGLLLLLLVVAGFSLTATFVICWESSVSSRSSPWRPRCRSARPARISRISSPC